MLPLPDILMILGLGLLVITSGFFSGCETAMFSLRPHQRMRLSRSRTLAGETVASLLSHPRQILVTLLMANTTVNVSYFVISTVLMIRARDSGQLGPLGTASVSVLLLIGLILLGEVLPKLLAAKLRMQWSLATALPLMFVHKVLTPLRVVFSSLIITPLARLVAPREKPASLSASELETILDHSLQRGVIDQQEEHLLQQVLELSQLKVRDLMTPRVDIQAFDAAADTSELLDLAQSTKHSRIPVCKDGLDHIEGIVLVRQVLLAQGDPDLDINKLVRQVVFVPELQRADQLLVHFRKTGTTFAIAVDEYGGTSGLITLEDVVEHMVGEIVGPHEAPVQPQVQQVQPGLWRVSANLPMYEWMDAFAPYTAMTMALGPETVLRAGVSTLGGLVMAKLGRLPKVGDHAAIGNVTLEVESMRGRRIEWLTIRLTESPKGRTSE